MAGKAERPDLEALLQGGDDGIPHGGDAGEAVDQHKGFHDANF